MAYISDETFNQACFNFEALQNAHNRPWNDEFRRKFFTHLGMAPDDEYGNYDYRYVPLPNPNQGRWWFPDEAASRMRRLASPYFHALIKAAEINGNI